jgi:N-acetylneuraminate synthase
MMAETTTPSDAQFRIGPARIGAGRCFIIAEVAQAHEGSLGLAHAFIEAAHAAKADAVKFQTHIAAAESTLDEPFRVRFSSQDATRYDYWRRMEFRPEQWAELSAHAAERGLVFLSSAFSRQAVALLDGLGVAAWKIASGELGSTGLLDAMVATGKPFLVSSGMSPWQELDALVQRLKAAPRPVAVMQCTSCYPTSLQDVGLNVVAEMARRYGVPVGLSDHSGTIYPSLAAIARGASVLELHLTLDRRMFGPDVPASLTPEEFATVTAFRDALLEIDSHPVDKDAMAERLAPMRALFRRSLAPERPLAAGTLLEADMIVAKKPGTGIPEGELAGLIGRRLRRDVAPDRLLTWQDLEP